jgi:hypothetical protein
MARSLTTKNIIQQVEHMFGRQSENYIMRIVNDALLDIAEKKQHYQVSSKTNLEQKKRWYQLQDEVVDVIKVEILDSNDRYVMIPKLTDPHRLLREDTDGSDDSLT